MPRPFKRRRSKYDDIRDERRKARDEQARQNAKRRKLEKQQAESLETGSVPEGADYRDTGKSEPVFYGLLDPDEQAYYADINNKITANDFEDEEDRRSFVQAVYRESQGKELKLASSQSCSRHLERIILVSTPQQLIALFEQLLEGFTHLTQHRFGSHVLETLFFESAKYVKAQDAKRVKQDDISLKLEALFLQAARELEPNIGYLLTDRFGSHVVRSLVLVLSGEPVQDQDTKKLLASKKKEKLDVPTREDQPHEAPREVTTAFKTAVSDLITTAVSSLDSTYVRALATHPTGNPVLQLLLKIELVNSGKGKNLGEGSLFHKLFPPNSFEEESEGAKAVSGLTYDTTGSHLIEIVVQYASGKTFKKLYKNVWRPRMASMAKNDVASYVAIKILQRVGKDDLGDVRDILLPELPTLLERRRLIVVQTLVDRCVVRGTDLKPVAQAMKAEFDKDRRPLLKRLLYTNVSSEVKASTTNAADSDEPSRADIHGSLLAQSLLEAPLVSILIQDSLLATDSNSVIAMAKDSSASRVLQTALTSSSASMAFRKQMIPKFYDHLTELATSTSGSYMVESLWNATDGLHFMRERIAGELARHENELRDSPYGRNVWRNWSMDLYIRRRGEWQAQAKGRDGKPEAFHGQQKSAIQVARERYAERQVKTAQNSIRRDDRLKAEG